MTRKEELEAEYKAIFRRHVHMVSGKDADRVAEIVKEWMTIVKSEGCE